MSDVKRAAETWTVDLHDTRVSEGRRHAFVYALPPIPIAAVVLGVDGSDESEGRRRAAMITAAPELLAALLATGTGKPTMAARKDRRMCWCFGWASQPCVDQPQCVAARAVVAKATGAN